MRIEHNIDIGSLLKAKKMLDEAVLIAKSDLEKTGAIQCFEYCYELSWKTMMRIMLSRGLDLEGRSPRVVFRKAARENLIDDPEIWFEVQEKRNLTSHSYNEECALEVFEFLPTFQKELNKFIHTITT